MLVTFAPTFDRANSTYEKKNKRREHAKRDAGIDAGYARAGKYPVALQQYRRLPFG